MKGLLQVGSVNQEACLHSQGTHPEGKETNRQESGTLLSLEPHILRGRLGFLGGTLHSVQMDASLQTRTPRLPSSPPLAKGLPFQCSI